MRFDEINEGFYGYCSDCDKEVPMNYKNLTSDSELNETFHCGICGKDLTRDIYLNDLKKVDDYLSEYNRATELELESMEAFAVKNEYNLIGVDDRLSQIQIELKPDSAKILIVLDEGQNVQEREVKYEDMNVKMLRVVHNVYGLLSDIEDYI